MLFRSKRQASRVPTGGAVEAAGSGRPSLRGVAVGRRNWTFFGSDNGGRTAAVPGSLIATSKRHHLDPFACLRDVFARISGHPQNRLEELLPDRWLASRSPATA